jgi:hypothetical protein
MLNSESVNLPLRIKKTIFIHRHMYFMLRGQELIQVFHKWTEVDLEFTEVDQHLYRDVNLIAGVVYTSAILENALLQIIFLYLPGDSESAGNIGN